MAADEVVLCAGAEAESILASTPELADALPRIVRSKGVGLLLASSRRNATTTISHVIRTPNRHYACGLHVVPRVDGSVYVGATNRVSRFAGTTGDVTASDLVYLLGGVTNEISTELEHWNLEQSYLGYRPLSVDGLPIAGRTAVDGLSVGTGSYRNGILLAPIMADAIVRDLERSSPDGSSVLSPLFSRRKGDSDAAAAALRSGLEDLDSLFHDAGVAWWLSRREAILAATLELTRGADDQQLPTYALDLMRRYPRPEMVPELLVELLEISDGPM